MKTGKSFASSREVITTWEFILKTNDTEKVLHNVKIRRFVGNSREIHGRTPRAAEVVIVLKVALAKGKVPES